MMNSKKKKNVREVRKNKKAVNKYGFNKRTKGFKGFYADVLIPKFCLLDNYHVFHFSFYRIYFS